MRRGHRQAHAALTLASAALGASLLAAAWAARTAQPKPRPFARPGADASVEGLVEWTVALPTPQGPAEVSYRVAHGRGRFHASLPPGLEAAEPGLILEVAERADTLGSVNAVRPSLPAPSLPVQGGRLVLADFARGLRLAEAPLPESIR